MWSCGKWRLYVNCGLPQLQPWGGLLSHVLNEPLLILPSYLLLPTLMLLVQFIPSLLVELLLLLPHPLQPFLHVLPLLHLL